VGFAIVTEVELVGGELLDDESVERKILVERADDVIAIRVGERILALRREDVAAGVRVARDIEPMARPSVAVARRGEKALDDALPSIGTIVREELLDLARCRRKPGEIEGRAADERASICLRGGLESAALERAQHELVDRRANALGRRVDRR